jgi:hypothetical protein
VLQFPHYDGIPRPSGPALPPRQALYWVLRASVGNDRDRVGSYQAGLPSKGPGLPATAGCGNSRMYPSGGSYLGHRYSNGRAEAQGAFWHPVLSGMQLTLGYQRTALTLQGGMSYTTVRLSGQWPGHTGTVTVTPTRTMINSGIAVTTTPVSYNLDSTGSVAFDVSAIDDSATLPQGVEYEIVIQIGSDPPQTWFTPVLAAWASTGQDLTLLPWTISSDPTAPAMGSVEAWIRSVVGQAFAPLQTALEATVNSELATLEGSELSTADVNALIATALAGLGSGSGTGTSDIQFLVRKLTSSLAPSEHVPLATVGPFTIYGILLPGGNPTPAIFVSCSQVGAMLNDYGFFGGNDASAKHFDGTGTDDARVGYQADGSIGLPAFGGPWDGLTAVITSDFNLWATLVISTAITDIGLPNVTAAWAGRVLINTPATS